jgi:hypothetical protein
LASGMLMFVANVRCRILSSGINCVLPFIDTPRPFRWERTFINSSGIPSF